MFVQGIHAFCILLWNQSLHSLLYQKLEVRESGSTLHQLCMMVASCLQKRELRYPRFGLQDIDCDLGCLKYVTAASQWRIVEIRDSSLSLRGLEARLPAFQLPMFAKCEGLPKGDLFIFVRHACQRESFEIKASIPYQKQVPASSSTLHQFCIMVTSCPFLRCSCRKRTRLAEKPRVWSGSSGHQDLLQCSVCALSCGMRLLQTNEHLSRLSS